MTDSDYAGRLIADADHGTETPRAWLLVLLTRLEARCAIAGDCVTAFRLRAARVRMVARLAA